MYDDGLEIELEAEGGKRGIWHLRLVPLGLELTSPDHHDHYSIRGDTLAQRVQLRRMPFGPPLMVVRLDDGGAVAFPLDREHQQLVQAWLRPVSKDGLKIALGRRSVWTFVIGLVLVLASVSHRDGLAGVPPGERFFTALGVMLMAVATLMRAWPRRELLLVDGLWLAVASLSLVWSVALRGPSPAWLVVAAIAALASVTGFRSYGSGLF